jgi:hypothetical protein
MADNNEIDSLKLGIEVGDLSSSDIKNIKDLSSSLAALDKVLSSEFMKNLETLSHLKINVNVSELKQAAKQVQKAVAPELKDGAIFGGDVDIAEEKKRLQKVMKQRQQAIDENLEYSQKIFDGASGNPFQLRAEELQKEQDVAQATLQSYKEMAKEARKTKQALESTVFGANSKTSYQYIGKDLTAVKQTITGTLDKITITTKGKSNEVKKAIDSIFEESGKSAKDSAAVFIEKGVIEPEIKANEQQEKHISLWEKFKQKVKSVGDVIKKLGDREDKEEKKSKASGFGGKLGKAIVRVAIYRAIRAAIKGIVQTIRQGLQAFAEFSPKFEQTMTALTSAGRNFKMSFTAAFAPILESIAPALIQIVNSFTQLNNKLAETIAYLKGAGEYTKVNTEYQEQYNKAVNLLPFDKFNVLQQSSYGGFEKAAVDTEKMAKNAPKLEKIKAVITSFKEALKAVVATLGKAWEYIKSIFGEYGDVILAFMKSSIDFSKLLWQTLGSLLNVVKVILNLDFSKSIIYTSLTLLSGVLTTIVGIAKTFLDIINSILNRDFSGFGERVKSYFNFGFTKNLWNRGRRGGFIKDFLKWKFHIGTYATGGLPDTGSLFLAGERGAELVTNVGSGQSAVMNMQQLQQAIYGGMVSALSTMQQVGGHETAQPITVKIGEDTLFEITRKSATRRGLDFAKV